MVRGLYSAWTGMKTEQKRLDVIANNIANASTLGYKKSSVTNQSFDDVLTVKIKDQSSRGVTQNIGTMNLGVKLGQEYTDHGQGSFRETGNSLDFSIEGRGFFAINRVDSDNLGETFYTRAGAFNLDSNGNLVDGDGNFLLGQNGAITIPNSAGEIAVSNDGIIFVDGQAIDQILVVDFENYESLEKVGDTMYRPTETSVETTSDYYIHQGYTEQSNVSVVREMVDMISVTRAYEANQKVIQTIDGTLDLASNSVGRI
ncbi:MAG: flagellar basal-body rod protein FlgF [Clostridiales bacterium]|nr:flagellar basal-body rod protein FlgF [Clostridiales bacterium]